MIFALSTELSYPNGLKLLLNKDHVKIKVVLGDINASAEFDREHGNEFLLQRTEKARSSLLRRLALVILFFLLKM